jgi:ABC-type proline/glycine betaine transport system ATPase subunit
MDERKERQQRVEELLELVSLSDVAGRKLKTFSGGMKRRNGRQLRLAHAREAHTRAVSFTLRQIQKIFYRLDNLLRSQNEK